MAGRLSFAQGKLRQAERGNPHVLQSLGAQQFRQVDDRRGFVDLGAHAADQVGGGDPSAAHVHQPSIEPPARAQSWIGSRMWISLPSAAINSFCWKRVNTRDTVSTARPR